MTYKIPEDEIKILNDSERCQTKVWNVDSPYYGKTKSSMNHPDLRNPSNKYENRPLNELQDKLANEIVIGGHGIEKAKELAGYSENTNKYCIMKNEKVKESIEDRRKKMWNLFESFAQEALDVQLDIMRSEKVSAKSRLDATNSILDRAGYKAVERREIVGAIGTVAVESKAVNDFAERARKLINERLNSSNPNDTISDAEFVNNDEHNDTNNE